MKPISISASTHTETITATRKRSGFCERATAAPITSAVSTMISGRSASSRR